MLHLRSLIHMVGMVIQENVIALIVAGKQSRKSVSHPLPAIPLVTPGIDGCLYQKPPANSRRSVVYVGAREES